MIWAQDFALRCVNITESNKHVLQVYAFALPSCMHIFGMSLSEPHTCVTALRMCVCMLGLTTYEEILNLRIYKKSYMHVQIANSSLNAKIYYDHGVLTIFFNDRASKQPEARRPRLDTERSCIYELRAREQPEARQARPNRQCERDHKRKTMEQAEVGNPG